MRQRRLSLDCTKDTLGKADSSSGKKSVTKCARQLHTACTERPKQTPDTAALDKQKKSVSDTTAVKQHLPEPVAGGHSPTASIAVIGQEQSCRRHSLVADAAGAGEDVVVCKASWQATVLPSGCARRCPSSTGLSCGSCSSRRQASASYPAGTCTADLIEWCSSTATWLHVQVALQHRHELQQLYPSLPGFSAAMSGTCAAESHVLPLQCHCGSC